MDEEEEYQGLLCFLLIAALSTLGILLCIIGLLIRWCKQDKLEVSKTCDNSECKYLNRLMVDLVKRELAFEDAKNEERRVREHLIEMAIIHGLGNTPDEIKCQKDDRKKTEMYQCLRTTLVRHPNDLRGRRRANRARPILMYHVFDDKDPIYHIESCFMIGYSCLNKSAKKFLKHAQSVIMFSWKVTLYLADMWSDFQVLVVIFAASNLATTTFNNMTTEAQQGNTTKTNAFKNVTDLCPGATRGAFKKLTNLLSNYSYSLLFAMLPNLIAQLRQCISLIGRTPRSFRGHNVWNITKKSVKYIVLFPFNTFTKMFSIKLAMEDAEEEEKDYFESFEEVDERTRKRYAERQARNTGIIAESFLESQATMKVLLGYYLALCYITGPGHDQLDCISKTFLEQFDIAIWLTIYSKGSWSTLGLPKLAFSSLTSLLSITFGQVNAYKVRHEYDMKISGTVLYIISSALVAFAKVSGQILVFASFYCVILKQDLGYWTELALLQVPHLYPLITTWVSYYIVNMHELHTGRLSGYPLLTKFMPVVEYAGRGDDMYGIARLNVFKICAHQETDSVKQSLGIRLALPIHRQIKKLPGGKYISLALATFCESANKQLLIFVPHKFSFDSTMQSRVRYQWRFCFAIGKNFILTNLDLLIASLIWLIPGQLKLDLKEINSARPAWRNTCFIIFGSIIANYLGLLCFWMFYKYGHIWKSKGVSVGYEYAENYDRQDPLPCKQQAMAKGYRKEYPNLFDCRRLIANDWRRLKLLCQAISQLFCCFLTWLCQFKPCIYILCSNALIKAAKLRNLDKVRRLIEEEGAQVDCQDVEGMTALQWASYIGHLDIAKALLQYGAQEDLQCYDGGTALHYASIKGHLDIAKALLQNGAQEDIQSADGWTALHLASREGHLDIAKALLQNGAQVNIQDNAGFTALHMASQKGHLDIAKSLLQHGAQVNIQNNDGDTALHWASKKGHLDISKALLQNGAQVNIQEHIKGWTALHIAYKANYMEIVAVLRESGARYPNPCNPWSVQFEGRWACTIEK